MYVFAVIHAVLHFSNYSRAASISFRACSGAATIQGGVYSRVASIWSYTIIMCSLMPTQYQSLVHKLLSDISPLPDWPCVQSHIPLPSRAVCNCAQL